MLDIIHRLNRLQLQSDIIQECGDQIRFPRMEQKEKVRKACPDPSALPNRNEIISQIERARKDATADISMQCGIKNMKKNNFKCQVNSREKSVNEQIDSDDDESDEEYESSDGVADVDKCEIEQVPENLAENGSHAYELMGVTERLELRNYARSLNANLNEDGRFAIVSNGAGKEMLVRKSSICWLLSKNKYKLSADRLQRVKENEVGNVNQKGKILRFTGLD